MEAKQIQGHKAVEKFCVNINFKLKKEVKDSQLGVIFTVKDAAYSDFEMTLLAKSDGTLILGIKDALQKKHKIIIDEKDNVFDRAYMLVQIKKDKSGAKLEIYFNSYLNEQCTLNDFYWPPYLKPQFILGSPIGGSFPSLVSEFAIYTNYLNETEKDQISKYFMDNKNNIKFPVNALELGPGKHYEIK